MVKVAVKHCGYGFIEETANSMTDCLKNNEQFYDLKVTPLSDTLACVMLIYREDNK